MSDTSEFPLVEQTDIETEADNTEALVVAQAPANALAVREAGIAAFLQSAYAKAGTLKLSPEETKILKADFPDSDIITGAAGKENLLYVEAPALRNRMDEALGMGNWSLVPLRTWNEEYKTGKNEQAVRVYHECVLIVRGVYITQAIGDMTYYPGNASTNYGDAFEGSQSASLRRCLKQFGVGLQCWSKVWCAGWFERQRANRNQASAPPRPAATAPAAPPSAKPKAPINMATANTRAAALDRLGAQEEGTARNTLHSYLVALGWLENTKTVDNWPVRFVPITAEELEGLKLGLANFSQTGKAIMPYQPHGIDPATLDAKPVTPVQAPAPPPTVPMPEPAATSWRDYVLTFGGASLKGKKLGTFDRSQVESFARDFQVQEFVERDGTKHFYAPQQVQQMKDFRAALDAAVVEFSRKKE